MTVNTIDELPDAEYKKVEAAINSSEGFMRGSAFGNAVNLQGNPLGKR